MKQVTVTRKVQFPDPVRIRRYLRLPELGPRLLFFSGGSSLKGVSETLQAYTHNSVHLLTPFDSGGSSAKLRKSFDMPAVGDIRSRLMALADKSISGNPEVYDLARYRLSEELNGSELREELKTMTDGSHRLVQAIPNPLRRLIQLQLEFFCARMPDDFELKGASIGNLILTGGYLNYQRHLDPILYLFSKLLAVRGTVRAITSESLHLAAELNDGSLVLGQHRFTGKETSAISSPIKKLSLSSSDEKYRPVSPCVKDKVHSLIAEADLICYPPGSFYSSVVANLLPKGVGSAVADNICPKIYIPNLGCDPEQLGMTLKDCVGTLLSYLRADAGEALPANRFIDYVIMDTHLMHTVKQEELSWLKEQGIELIDLRLTTDVTAKYYDDRLLVEALLSLT